jgi:hypothetical protein
MLIGNSRERLDDEREDDISSRDDEIVSLKFYISGRGIDRNLRSERARARDQNCLRDHRRLWDGIGRPATRAKALNLYTGSFSRV